MYFFLIHTLLIIIDLLLAFQMMNSKYMMYLKDIYHHLINQMLASDVQALFNQKECRGKLDATAIKNLGNDRFFVKYFNNETWNTYQVNFGDEESMPSCTCYSSRTSAYLCNQFFEIFKKFPAWDWDLLWSLYRNSPYFKLDEFDENPVEDNMTI